jgi:type VI protein secretion system component Hcp
MDRLTLRRPTRWVLVISALLAALLAVAVVTFGHARSGGQRLPRFTLGQALLTVDHGDPIYLQYTGVTGAPSSLNHTNHAQIFSFQLAVSRKISAGGPAVGRNAEPPQTTEACLTKRADKYSAGLFNASLLGTAKDAILYFTKNGIAPYVEYLRFEFQDTLVSSWRWNSGGNVPTESFCLNFTKLVVTFEPAGQHPQVQSWDFVTNAPLPAG